MSRRTAVALSLMLGLLPVVAVAAPASAHTEIVGTTPKQGATVDAPSEVVITLSQAALKPGTQVEVLAGDDVVSEGTPRLVDETVRQSLRPGLAAGAYTVLYRVTSADGHPVSGEFAFKISAASTSDATTPAVTPSATTGAVASTPESSPTSVAQAAGLDGDDGMVALGAAVVVAGAAAVLVAAVLSRRRRPRA